MNATFELSPSVQATLRANLLIRTGDTPMASRLRRIRVVAESAAANLRELRGTRIDYDDMTTILELIEREAQAALDACTVAEKPRSRRAAGTRLAEI